jgi:hypothetical protein
VAERQLFAAAGLKRDNRALIAGWEGERLTTREAVSITGQQAPAALGRGSSNPAEDAAKRRGFCRRSSAVRDHGLGCPVRRAAMLRRTFSRLASTVARSREAGAVRPSSI